MGRAGFPAAPRGTGFCCCLGLRETRIGISIMLLKKLQYGLTPYTVNMRSKSVCMHDVVLCPDTSS